MTTTVAGALDGSDYDQMQSALWSKISVTARRKEALQRALSNLDHLKRKATPEVAQEVVSRHVDHYTENSALPPLIAGFLDKHWRFYMANLYVLEGEQSKPWCTALENTVELIWSLQPKCDEESRQRLFALLPGLLEWIHTVLDARGVEASDEDVFFTQLARFHAAALNADTRAVGESAPHAADEPTFGNSPASQSCNDADGTPDRAKAADSRRSQPKPNQVPTAESDPLRDLVVGTWVEFQSERETKRVMRLEWISGRGGVYLFRDEKTGDALCLTAQRCIQSLRERSASILH